ncbi:single-stranded DNA-binding protein, partial [Acidiphilium sp.]|uniref:single-stranded DNA-binding protein n=1 Tax=Acidiphilium sp. TaxID=527 RepID=UPI003D04C781
MAGSMNRVTLIGNLGNDPEIRVTQAGGKVASMSLATSESWTDKRSGERQERTEWHRIVVWTEGLIGVIEKYCAKGDKVMVEGALRTRKWVDQEGNE